MTDKTQWQRRVDVTQITYSCLIKNLNKEEILASLVNFDIDANQAKVLEYIADNYDQLKEMFSSKLSNNWTWDRLSYMVKSILLVAYAEVKAINTPIAVAIDQALITADKYGQLKEKKFLNAILDKTLK